MVSSTAFSCVHTWEAIEYSAAGIVLTVTQAATGPWPPHRHPSPAAMPITKAPAMPTLPAAGVMATSPDTAPEAAPTIEGLPLKTHSPKVHASTAHAGAGTVLRS